MSDEIEAARIAAQATYEAAWIQGGMTFMAGLAAVLGGYLAYKGAVKAAGAAVKAAARQVQLAEERHVARVAAYRSRIITLAEELGDEARFSQQLATTQLEHIRKSQGNPLILHLLSTPPEFLARRWEDHALLGVAAIRAIRAVEKGLREYELFRKDVSDKKLQGEGYSEHIRMKGTPTGMADGGLNIDFMNAAEQYEAMSKEIVRAIDTLLALIRQAAPSVL